MTCKAESEFKASLAGTATSPEGLLIPAGERLENVVVPADSVSRVSFTHGRFMYTATRHDFFEVGGCHITAKE